MALDLLTGRGGNFIVNFPKTVGADGSPEYWTEEDANITVTWTHDLPSESPAVPEDIYTSALKVVLTAANKSVYQRISFADHEGLLAPMTVSASVWVYQSTTPGDEITFSLEGDSSGVLDSISTSVDDTWTKLSLRNCKLSSSDTYVDFKLSADGAASEFYFTKPMFNLGPRPLPFVQNPIVLENSVNYDTIVNATMSDTSWHSQDLSSIYPPLTVGAWLRCLMGYGGGAGSAVRVRASFETADNSNQGVEHTIAASGTWQSGEFFTPLGEDKIIQYKRDNTGISDIQLKRGRHYLRWAN